MHLKLLRIYFTIYCFSPKRLTREFTEKIKYTNGSHPTILNSGLQYKKMQENTRKQPPAKTLCWSKKGTVSFLLNIRRAPLEKCFGSLCILGFSLFPVPLFKPLSVFKDTWGDIGFTKDVDIWCYTQLLLERLLNDPYSPPLAMNIFSFSCQGKKVGICWLMGEVIMQTLLCKRKYLMMKDEVFLSSESGWKFMYPVFVIVILVELNITFMFSCCFFCLTFFLF